MPLPLLLAVLLSWPTAQQNVPQPDPIAELVLRLEAAAQAADRAAVVALGTDPAAVGELAGALADVAATRAVIKERDRVQTEAGGRLLLELFAETGAQGRLSTWTVLVVPVGAEWKIASAARLANVTGLHRLSLNPTTQYEVRNLTVDATDLALHVPAGTAFVAETPDGVTAVVLLGNGEMRFSPKDAAEQTQVRIFCGAPALAAAFTAAFVRLRPADFEARFPGNALIPRAVSPADLRRANEVFEEYVGKTLQIDLSDLSPERWSITPVAGDFIAEIRTRRYGSLTYTRSGNEAEDISLFDRARRRNISVYASREKLAQRGRFYSEDDLVDYDVLEYDIDASFEPNAFFIEGSARLKLKVRATAVSTLSLRLAESLTVRGVYSDAFGRVLHLRVIGQNTLLVNLPGFVVGGSEFWLTVNYSGRVQPQELDREAIALTQDPQESIVLPPEPRLLYSHRAYWYPQSSVSDYATAKVAMTLPSAYGVVATGAPQAPETSRAERETRAGQTSVFVSARPVRYLAFVVSRLRTGATRQVDGVQIGFVGNPRQMGHGRSVLTRTEDVMRYYMSLLGGAPYPSFTVAYTERTTPGGHSPAYFAVVDQPTQLGVGPWRGDPVNFEAYPEFFLAHEIAHQWWGQGVGWKNYHEQWISEGFAQYFALLYAEARLSRRAYATVLRQMKRTAMAASSQGPIYLGYRLGHIKREPAVFRSLVYNKSAIVLHMLRRLVGDEVFFAGVREFYRQWEFKKAGTGDFQRVMERVSGRSLGEFFETWIFGAQIPTVKFTHAVERGAVLLRFEQQGQPVEVPILVTLTDRGGTTTNVVVRVVERLTEQRVPFTGTLRGVDANPDHGALVTIRR